MKFFLLWFPQKLVFQTYYEMQLLTKEPRWLAKIQHVRKRYTFWQKPFIPSPNFWSRVVLQNKFLILTKLLKFTSKQKYFKFQNWNTDEEKMIWWSKKISNSWALSVKIFTVDVRNCWRECDPCAIAGLTCPLFKCTEIFESPLSRRLKS